MTSCGVSRAPTSANAPRGKILYGWYDDGGPGEVSIRISLPDQIAEFERDGREIGWCYVATGKEGHGTSPADYKITEMIIDKHSNRYGWIEDEFGNVVDGDAKYNDPVPEGMIYVPAPMPYWMRLTSYGIGMHGGLIPEPGKPASHGCIRLPKRFVPMLFDVVKVGTPVTITRSPSRRGMLGESLQPQSAPVGSPAVRVAPGSGYSGEGRVIATRPLTEADLNRMGTVSGTRVADPFGEY